MRSSRSKNNIRQGAALRRWVTRCRARRERIVFTNGCFDVLHIGHIRYLEQGKALGDQLIVAVNGDRAVRQLKGRGRPIQRQRDRAAILAALACVDAVTIFDDLTPARVIRAVRPDVLVKGGDWALSNIVGGSFVRSYGGRVVRLPFVRGRSTTRILRHLRARG